MSASPVEAPIIDFRRVETLEGLDIVLRVLGRLKEERSTLSTSSTPTLILVFALWQEKKRKDSSLPTYTFGMGAVYAHNSLEELI